MRLLNEKDFREAYDSFEDKERFKELSVLVQVATDMRSEDLEGYDLTDTQRLIANGFIKGCAATFEVLLGGATAREAVEHLADAMATKVRRETCTL